MNRGKRNKNRVAGQRDKPAPGQPAKAAELEAAKRGMIEEGCTWPARDSSRSRTKRMVFRAIALVVIPLALLGGFELFLHAVGYGFPAHFFIPGRIDGRKVVHDNQKFGWRFFPPAIARTPRPVRLPTPKPPGKCRVFVFGAG